MSLPGFWATSSLYKTTRAYHVRVTSAFTLGLTTVEGSPEFQMGQPAALLSESLFQVDSSVSCSQAECLYVAGLDYQTCVNEYLNCPRPVQPECYIAQLVKCKPVLEYSRLRCRDPAFQCQILPAPGTCIDGICCQNVCGVECCGSGTTCIKSADMDFCCPTQLACGDQCCSPGSACCGLPLGGCTDLTSDPSNCGACGNQCPAGQPCQHGICGGCPAGTTFCPDSPTGPCVNTQTDSYNCGSCGNQCPQQPCIDGKCGCPGGKVCGNVCCGVCQTCDRTTSAVYCRDCDSGPPNCEICTGGDCVGGPSCYNTCCGKCQLCDGYSQTCQTCSGCLACQANGSCYALPDGYPGANDGVCLAAGAGCSCGNDVIVTPQINEGYTCCHDSGTGMYTVCPPDQPVCCKGKCAKTC